MAKWEDMERIAQRMKDTFEKTRRHMPYQDRSNMESDIRKLEEETRKQRDAYVRWLYGR